MDVFDKLGIETEDVKATNIKAANEAESIGISLGTIKRDADDEQHKIFYGLTKEDRQLAIDASLIPEVYKDSAFNEEMIRANLIEQRQELKDAYTIRNFNEYIKTCNGILSAIRMKKMPDKSYIIGAPNGFGKTSFVTEAIITLNRHGFRVAPYITLSELNVLRVEEEKRLMSPFIVNASYSSELKKERALVYTYNANRGEAKTPRTVVGCFSFSEYVNSDCLFVALTGVNSKVVESYMLKQLLQMRSIKGLPTIVTTDTSLDIYFIDTNIKENVWVELLIKKEKQYCYDRLYHVSTYKFKESGSRLSNKNMNIDDETGIVN